MHKAFLPLPPIGFTCMVSMQAGPSFAKAIGMQCVFSFGNRSVPNAKIVALSEINLAFGLKNGPARACGAHLGLKLKNLPKW